MKCFNMVVVGGGFLSLYTTTEYDVCISYNFFVSSLLREKKSHVKP